MQRVAMELHEQLESRDDVVLDDVIMRGSLRKAQVFGLFFLIKVYREVKRKALNGEIDIVLFSSMATAATAFFLRRILEPLGIPMVAVVHGLDVTMPGIHQRFIGRVFDALAAVLPVSRATGAACHERGMPLDKIHVLPNGVDVSRFAPLTDFDSMRRDMKASLDDPAHPLLPEDALLLCSVGRQVERKGFAWFVDEVMPLLPEDVHYWMAGDGPEAENIAAAIEKHDLHDRVRMLGRISEEDLTLLYRGADLFIMPNIPVEGDMEGFGVVMLEAGLSGLPTIAARLEGIRDVITEGENGHLVESGDAWAFSEAIMAYYHNRPAMRMAALRAAKHTADTFCWAAVTERYVQTLRALLPYTSSEPVDTPAGIADLAA